MYNKTTLFKVPTSILCYVRGRRGGVHRRLRSEKIIHPFHFSGRWFPNLKLHHWLKSNFFLFMVKIKFYPSFQQATVYLWHYRVSFSCNLNIRYYFKKNIHCHFFIGQSVHHCKPCFWQKIDGTAQRVIYAKFIQRATTLKVISKGNYMYSKYFKN